MVLDKEVAPNYKECRLGKWYYNEKNIAIIHTQYYKSIESIYIGLHTEAQKAVDIILIFINIFRSDF
ncbi:MAG: CZB domain-containing protein [Clostridium paraputrificum]